MSENVGDFVDYVASAGRKANKNAKIIFKLDRIVLDELTEDPTLQKYSCLVIDEAHERTISIDVILGRIKELLTKRKDFKVIVTSASMDIQLFEKYFKTKTLKVSGRMYPVTVTYRDYANINEGKLQTVKKVEKVINEEILID
jgi:ATP-dependent helicase HrpA